jgi:hypothetical protein
MIRMRTVRISAGSRARQLHPLQAWAGMPPSKKLVGLAAIACGLALFVGIRYENVAEIFDSGADGVLRVQGVREDDHVTERDLLCDDNRTYTVTLDTLGGRLLKIRACRMFTVGQEYPVIASLDRLKAYIPPAPAEPVVVETYRHPYALGSRFFVIGSKSQAKWAVFAREFGSGTLALIAGLEALLIAAIYRTYKRTNRKESGSDG